LDHKHIKHMPRYKFLIGYQ